MLCESQLCCPQICSYLAFNHPHFFGGRKFTPVFTSTRYLPICSCCSCFDFPIFDPNARPIPFFLSFGAAGRLPWSMDRRDPAESDGFNLYTTDAEDPGDPNGDLSRGPLWRRARYWLLVLLLVLGFIGFWPGIHRGLNTWDGDPSQTFWTDLWILTSWWWWWLWWLWLLWLWLLWLLCCGCCGCCGCCCSFFQCKVHVKMHNDAQ